MRPKVLDFATRLEDILAEQKAEAENMAWYESQPTPPVWHKFHCDPVLDIVLLSRDGTCFRASSHALKRESSLSQGMLSSMPNDYQNVRDAISLDFSAAAIALFLDDYAVPNHPPYQILEFPLLHELHSLMRYLDCDRLSPKVNVAYTAACMRNPKDWLIAASNENDIMTATLALAQCRLAKISLNTENIYDTLAEIRLDWRYHLLQCLLYDRCGGASSNFHVEWPDKGREERFLKAVQDQVDHQEGAKYLE